MQIFPVEKARELAKEADALRSEVATINKLIEEAATGGEFKITGVKVTAKYLSYVKEKLYSAGYETVGSPAFDRMKLPNEPVAIDIYWGLKL